MSNIKQMEAVLEAVLFTMGESVSVERLAAAIEHDVETTKKIMHQMMDSYNSKMGGMKIIELEDAFQLCTRPEMYEALIRVAKQPKRQVLTDVLLETLSIIAYKQPITKAEIEKIRGVKSDHAVNKLVEYNLVMELGRLDAPGKPILFGTTEDFLRNFGVQSIEELPVIDVGKKAEFEQQALEEVQLKFGSEGGLITEEENEELMLQTEEIIVDTQEVKVNGIDEDTESE